MSLSLSRSESSDQAYHWPENLIFVYLEFPWSRPELRCILGEFVWEVMTISIFKDVNKEENITKPLILRTLKVKKA